MAHEQESGTYRGPHLVICEEELVPLATLLQLNPRPWNAKLRERIDHARKMKGGGNEGDAQAVEEA